MAGIESPKDGCVRLHVVAGTSADDTDRIELREEFQQTCVLLRQNGA